MGSVGTDKFSVPPLALRPGELPAPAIEIYFKFYPKKIVFFLTNSLRIS